MECNHLPLHLVAVVVAVVVVVATVTVIKENKLGMRTEAQRHKSHNARGARRRDFD